MLVCSRFIQAIVLDERQEHNFTVVSIVIAYKYRVNLVVEDLGWVDLGLGSFPSWRATIVATYCPSRVVEHAKSGSTQPRYSTTRVTL